MLIPTLHAILLGIVQGLGEFIPISSSGHLVLVPALLGIEPGGLAFDVALHLGTMFAVVVYLRRELAAILSALFGRRRDPRALVYRKLAWFAVAASVPVAVVGLVLESLVADLFATPLVAAAALVLTGVLLLAGEAVRDRRVAAANAADPVEAPGTGSPAGGVRPAGHQAAQADVSPGGIATAVADPADAYLPLARDPQDPAGADLAGMTLRQALVVGFAQCVALVPGVSRSGSTIVAGMVSGLTREAATRFSFLLSLPALVGATILTLPDLREPGPYPTLAIVAGVLAAFLGGYFAIGFLVRLVARERLTGFALYCFAAAAVAFAVLLLR